jgi:hypothetical protein
VQIVILHPTMSEAFVTGFAYFYFLQPFGLKDLSRGQATSWIWIEDGVDDVSTLFL